MRLVVALFVAVLAKAAVTDCGKCHSQARIERNPMASTLSSGKAWQTQQRLTASIAGYEYTVSKEVSGAWYQTRKGSEVIRVPIDWVFGTGRTGQTFIFTRGGKLYESRVSYYPAIRGLDLTIGAANSPATTLEEAAGRAMSPSDVTECFGCHSTGKFPSIEAGVQCQRCHGQASIHPGKDRMKAWSSATTEEISELCGECHRTWQQVMLLKLRGVNTVRFQPYRLGQSKCYDPVDRRISCTGCHDPHNPAEISAKRIDATCKSCHAMCPKGDANCAACHMPKYELPGAHATFTDHRIRIARKGESFPD